MGTCGIPVPHLSPLLSSPRGLGLCRGGSPRVGFGVRGRGGEAGWGTVPAAPLSRADLCHQGSATSLGDRQPKGGSTKVGDSWGTRLNPSQVSAPSPNTQELWFYSQWQKFASLAVSYRHPGANPRGEAVAANSSPGNEQTAEGMKEPAARRLEIGWKYRMGFNKEGH